MHFYPQSDFENHCNKTKGVSCGRTVTPQRGQTEVNKTAEKDS